MTSPSPCYWFGFLLSAWLACVTSASAADKTLPAFGDAVQLAPFVVNGKKLTISIHARNDPDRAYALKFAEEVVGIAYEAMDGESTGSGLVIIGKEGEPHPIVVIRKFQDLAAAGQLDPGVIAKLGDLEAKMKEWKAIMKLDEPPDDAEGFKITFDMIVPALPLPLEGIASKLYQLSWAEGFDEKRVEQRLRALTVADLEGDALSKYDWVFYLPPRNAYVGVQDAVVKGAIAKEKMGFFKRTTLKGALAVFKPAVKTAVEGFRKGMLFMTVLRAQSGYSKEDIRFLTGAYTNVLMPDFKFNGGSERQRALEAIAKQKAANAEYAKDPFIAPARLAEFDPAAYTAFEGSYGEIVPGKKGKPDKPRRALIRQDGNWLWQYHHAKPQTVYPAGERLFVSADSKMSIAIKVDERGAITAAEERSERYRETFMRL